ncbi:MAG: hypothetical protein KJO11_10000 [Gemmatimonadetes bacterium]|nr:hypothetical protein [Gemmatimonadota bacterium]
MNSPPTGTLDPTARATPSIRYRGLAEPTIVAEAPAEGRVRPAALEWLSRGVLVVVVAIWAVVGAVVWLPLLVRAMVRFSIALVPATLDGTHPEAAAQRLRGAVDFYRRGFIAAAAAVGGRPTGPALPARRKRDGGMVREVVWAAVIWYAVLAVIGVVWSPLEIGRWLLALPWSAWALSLGAWIVEPFV